MAACDANEMITGPWEGYYIAAYAVPTAIDREEYAPTFKLFTEPPASYFDDAGCVAKERPPIVTNDVARAIFLAMFHARLAIACLARESSSSV